MEHFGASTPQLKEVESEYVTAPTTGAGYATTSSSPFFSARSESMMKSRETGSCTSIEEQIERSKPHWSQLVESNCDDEEVAEISNVKVFKALQMHPTWGDFFRTFGDGEDDAGELVMGKKFAEGGQAELYEAQVKWRSLKQNEYDLEHGVEWVLKVFKKGIFLRQLQSQWPQGLLQFHAEEREHAKLNLPPLARYYCVVLFGTLLKDGRFAFLLKREDEDLRSLIDRCKHRAGPERGPFPKGFDEILMFRVARGMDWLHSRNIVHRDLKASNVLVSHYHDGDISYYVADYECAVGVVGTRFFRAPEILQAHKDRNVNLRPEIFTKAADVYSYGMTCYEILTGRLPFEGHLASDYDLVLGGYRPEVPEYVDEWIRELLRWCWESNPEARPSFGDILDFLLAHSSAVTDFKVNGIFITLEEESSEEGSVLMPKLRNLVSLWRACWVWVDSALGQRSCLF